MALGIDAEEEGDAALDAVLPKLRGIGRLGAVEVGGWGVVGGGGVGTGGGAGGCVGCLFVGCGGQVGLG